jgi:phosphatidylglycerol:prolipoprotein diacylglycerol transferase
MIPYFQYNYIIVGFLTLQVWGMFVAAGIIIAVLLATHLTKKFILSEEVVLDSAIWMLVTAMVFARLFHVYFYNYDFYASHSIEILKFWKGGLSSAGGFFGAFFGLFLLAKIRRFKLKELWPYFDIMAVSLWLGWGIGRIGCFFIHDHPGLRSDFFLAVNFPEGSRLDLGLLESLVGFVLFGVFYYLFNRLIKKRWGLVAIYSFLSYVVIRFFLDFLRASDLPGSDARYAHLTPAQWFSIVVVVSLTAYLFSDKIKAVLQKSAPSDDELVK